MPKRPSLAESVRAGRRATRVTAAAAVGFYPAAYLLDRPVTAVYALFTPIALGVLSPVPGSGRRRAATVLRALPAAAVLTAAGTALAVQTWSAVAGMLIVAFVLMFGSVCGPRLAGTAPGLQLFYILACFPPFAPETLPQRLTGVAIGGASLVLCEVVVLPDPPDPAYRERIADTLDLAAHATRSLIHTTGPEPGLAGRLRSAGRGLRFSQQPAGARPTGAGRADRAFAQAGSATRRLVDQLAALVDMHSTPLDTASQNLLNGIAAACAGTAGALRRSRPAVGPELIEEMIAQFVAARDGDPGGRVPRPHPVLVRQSTVLTIAVSAVTVRTAAALALNGRRPLHGLPREQFWYARMPTLRLFAIRLTGNLTRRSVVFQNALRSALGLALARLVAGSLDLSHGFWVLLTVLTLGRTTAGATWSAVRAAVVGTLAGALAAGLLLIGAGDATEVYAFLLVPMMLIAFAVGPLEGPSWAQGLFTLVVSTAFAQIEPVTWRLAEMRVVDVLTGSAVGLLCGVLAWPFGARAETRRSMTALLRSAAPVVRATAAAATDDGGGGEGTAGRGDADQRAVRLTLHRLRIAEGSYAQYRTEPATGAPEPETDYLAALNFGSRVLVGAYWLPRTERPRELPPAARHWARRVGEEAETAIVRAADFPPGGIHVRLPPPPALPSEVPPRVLSLLTDIEVWIDALAADLNASNTSTNTNRRTARSAAS
ncbi:putative membrane protein YccC [Streptomyces sp. 3330]|uniref:FUSC family protein n=1 Tax=Streptomyces sp. 3330 TaxID=2817755 RepID=UPI002858F631|nr:FUSC family protein [Streptomyces sp. 3330]MDR6974135.1 putative membrane protein YccC [Streptomyces sp. 3330]